MSTTVTAGNSASFQIGPFDTLTLSSGGARGTLALTSAAPKLVADQVLGIQNGTFGPWGAPMTAALAVSQGSLDYTVNPQSLTISQVTALQALGSSSGTTTWANRAAVLTAGLANAFFTDVGVGGSFWYYSGGRWRPSAGRCVLKNLVTAVSNSAAPKVVLDYATIPAGLWQDGDILDIEFQKTREGGTSDTDATDVMIGSAPTTLGTSTGLSTSALATTTIHLTPRYRLQRVSATSVRNATIPGGVGLGSTTSLPSTTTGLPNADSVDTYLQVTSDLTTAGGEVAWLRAFTVTLVVSS